MKKILIAFFISIMLSTAVSAADYTDKQEVIIKTENINEVKAISRKDLAFSVTFNLNENQPVEYVVEYILDDKVYTAGRVLVKPYEETKKTFKFDAEYGMHNLTVNVKRDGKIIKTFTDDRVAVAERYQPQFMDKYSRLGIAMHFAHGISDGSNYLTSKYFDYFKYAGTQTIRDNPNPNMFTTLDDGHNLYTTHYAKNSRWWIEKLNRTDMSILSTNVGVNGNWEPYNKYPDDISPEDGDGSAPTNPEAIKGYADNVIYQMGMWNATKEVELWNEANYPFMWSPQNGHSASDYANMTKQTSVSIAQKYPEKDIAAFTAANLDLPWHRQNFESGIYPYIHAIDVHRYCANMEPEVGGYITDLESIEDIIVENGGWMFKISSEIGVSTSGGRTEDDQVRRLAKEYCMMDEENHTLIYIHSSMDKKDNPTDPECNFGLVKNDHRPKKGYLAYVRYCQELNSSVYLGKVDLGIEDSWGYMYLVNGQPRMVAWVYSADYKKTAEFKADNITARDYYGNVLCKNADSVTLTNDPIYIDIGEEWLAKAVHDATAAKQKAYISDYADVLGAELTEKAKAVFADTQKTFEKVATAEETEKIVNRYAELGGEIIADGKAGKLSEIEVSRCVYGLYRMVMPINVYYMKAYEGSARLTADYNGMLDFVGKKYRNNSQIMQYSDKMFKLGETTYLRAKDIAGMGEHPAKAGVVAGYNQMASVLWNWVRDFAEYETVINYGVTLQVPSYDLNVFPNENKNIRLALRNQSKISYEGKVVVTDEEGKVCYESKNIKLSAGATVKHPFKMLMPEAKSEDGRLRYKYSFVDKSGKEIISQIYTPIVHKTISIRVLTATDSTENLRSIKLEIKNQRKDRIEFDLEMSTLEDIKLGREKTELTLEPDEARIIEIPISYIKDNKYHFYPISYKATDTDGYTIADADTLLNFSCIVKAEEPITIDNFDGSLKGWEDAYPVYVNTPSDSMSAEAWENADIAARVFTKWDDEHFYVLYDVHDDYHAQINVDRAIYNGDNIQIGVNALNENVVQYTNGASSVYEFGPALNKDAGLQFYFWSGTSDYSDYKEWTSIVRNDENKTTRYLMCIPKSALPLLELKAGNTFGLNFAINDADVVYRDEFVEFTEGIARVKDATAWSDFKFLEKQKAGIDTYEDGIVGEIFKN